jgi:hypothetical protein
MAETKTDPKVERYRLIQAEMEKKKTKYAQFWDPIYEETEKHLRFTLQGKQLEENQIRELGLRHPKEPNLLITYANKVINKTLQTDYRGKVTPAGSGADDVKARERQDVIRGLQRLNKFNQLANQVKRNQVAGGIAYSLKKIEFAAKRGFGKTIKNEFLDDYKNVYPDIHVKSPTFDDAEDFLIRQDIPEEQWEAKTGQKVTHWGNAKTKPLWSYWKKELKADVEYLREDGDTVMESTLPELKGNKFGGKDLRGVKVGDDMEPLGRPTEDFTWTWYMEADKKIIREEKWLSAYSPLVACTGARVDSKDKTYFQPLTLFAEEPQLVYTLIENIQQLRLGRSPFSKWKVAFESIVTKQMRDLRDSSELGGIDILYKALSDDGQTSLPAPEEIEAHVMDPMLITLQAEQVNKMERIFGLSDAAFGRKTNETSGIAIERRQQVSDESTYHSEFNFMLWVEQVTRGDLDCIGHYLTAPQQMAFINEDDQMVVRWLNTTGGVTFSPNEEYTLAIEAVPISPTAREDEAAFLSKAAERSPLIANNPEAMAIVLEAQPGLAGKKLANVLRSTNPQVAQAKQVIQQQQAQLQKLTQDAQLSKAQDALKIQTLQSSLTICKQVMGMMKQQHAAEQASAKGEGIEIGEDPRIAEMDGTIKSMELQLEEFKAHAKAQTDQQNADSRTMDAETNRMKLGHEMSKPEPQPEGFPA